MADSRNGSVAVVLLIQSPLPHDFSLSTPPFHPLQPTLFQCAEMSVPRQLPFVTLGGQTIHPQVISYFDSRSPPSLEYTTIHVPWITRGWTPLTLETSGKPRVIQPNQRRSETPIVVDGSRSSRGYSAR